MPDAAASARPAAWLSGQYPYSSGPGFRWKNAFLPDTVMTPVTQAQITANPEAVLLDTMPSDYTLLGESGDGTMGPLGFGKILVTSGAFDRCAVKRMYERFVGRALDPAVERLYIEKLAREFVVGLGHLRWPAVAGDGFGAFAHRDPRQRLLAQPPPDVGRRRAFIEGFGRAEE